MKFKFESRQLQQKLQNELRKAKNLNLIHKREGGFVIYDERLENKMDDAICVVRYSVFPKWQILTFPVCEWDTYMNYIKRRKIPHEIEVRNDERRILLSRDYKPLNWKLQWKQTCHMSCG